MPIKKCNMKKRQTKSLLTWLGIFAIVLAIALSIKIVGQSPTSGIKIHGGAEGKDWEFSNPRRLLLKSNYLTISGTADADLKIECEGTSQLTINNLKQGDHKLYIFSVEDKEVHVSGKNELTWISGWKAVKIQGESLGAELLLSDKISAEDIYIDSIKVRAELLKAERDITITGKSHVTIKKGSDKEDAAADVRVKAGRMINIDLDPGGSIAVDVDEGRLPFLAEKKLTLGKENTIVVPENGVARGEDTPYGPNCYFIFDENDDWDSNIVIENMDKE